MIYRQLRVWAAGIPSKDFWAAVYLAMMLILCFLAVAVS